jgi:sugar-specific transcriptional regulator TrmB
MVGDTPEGSPLQRAVEQLQQLGLKQYEAKCFVSLTSRSSGTAREISDHVGVPRTRVYEAVRVLEKEGLVEVQHSSPQRFRAIPIGEAVEILQRRYESRIESLEAALEELDADGDGGDEPLDQEVWALSEKEAIRTRTRELVGDADDSVRLVLGTEDVLTDGLLAALEAAGERGVDVVVGAVPESLAATLEGRLDDPEVFESRFPWLQAAGDGADVDIGRVLLVDDESVLASTVGTHDEDRRERAVCGNGCGNSLVFVFDRLLAAGIESG